MNTGERIKSRRKQLSISADVLAKRIGVSRSTVFRWENGDVEKRDAKLINSIADALNTTAEYLNGVIDDPDAVIEVSGDSAGKAPRTREARIISHGVDYMPTEDRERAMAMIKIAFPQYFDDEGENSNDA